MDKAAFLVIPLEPMKLDEDWASLSKAARLERQSGRLHGLTEAIRERLGDMDVEELAGVGGWIARTGHPASREQIAKKLEGLPVMVAPDSQFHAV